MLQWCERRCAKIPTFFRAVQPCYPAAPAAANVRQVTRRHHLKQKCAAHRMKPDSYRPSATRSTRLGPSVAICRKKSASSAGICERASKRASSLSGRAPQRATKQAGGSCLVRNGKVHCFILSLSPPPLAEAASGGTRCTRRRACRCYHGCRYRRSTPWCHRSTCPCTCLAPQPWHPAADTFVAHTLNHVFQGSDWKFTHVDERTDRLRAWDGGSKVLHRLHQGKTRLPASLYDSPVPPAPPANNGS